MPCVCDVFFDFRNLNRGAAKEENFAEGKVAVVVVVAG